MEAEGRGQRQRQRAEGRGLWRRQRAEGCGGGRGQRTEGRGRGRGQRAEGRDAHFFSPPSHIVEKLDYDREVIFLFLFCICFVGFLEIDLATSFLYTLFSNWTNTMAWNDFILSVFRTHFTAAILLQLEYFCFLGRKMVKRLKISSVIFIF